LIILTLTMASKPVNHCVFYSNDTISPLNWAGWLTASIFAKCSTRYPCWIQTVGKPLKAQHQELWYYLCLRESSFRDFSSCIWRYLSLSLTNSSPQVWQRDTGPWCFDFTCTTKSLYSWNFSPQLLHTCFRGLNNFPNIMYNVYSIELFIQYWRFFSSVLRYNYNTNQLQNIQITITIIYSAILFNFESFRSTNHLTRLGGKEINCWDGCFAAWSFILSTIDITKNRDSDKPCINISWRE
jgi:hypothetical protein